MAAILAPTKRTLTSLLSKTLSPSSSRSRLALLCIFNQHLLHPSPPHSSFTMPTRYKTSESGYSPLNDPSPNSSNQPLKDTIRLEGCDYEHWLIVMEFPSETKPSEDQMINSYVKTLASVLGSEEEAKQKIYSVNTRTYTGFGALISEELSDKVKGLPGVLWVLPDSYLDVPNKDYGGDLFVDGKVIHRPQYWCNESQQSIRRGFRPRYDQRQRTMPVERRLPLQGNNTSLPQQGGPIQQLPPAPGSTVPVPPQVVEVASL